MNHPSWIEIDVAQLKKNISLIQKHIGKSLFCLPVKANAYGHGLCPIGKIAEDAGIHYLAVAHAQEGVRLRQAGIAVPILVFGAIHEDQISDLLDYNLDITISSRFKADLLAAVCTKTKKTCSIHLEVDTGMQRTGVRPSSAINLLNHVKSLQCFKLVGIYSHFAQADRPADPFTLNQLTHFKSLMQEPLLYHIANSGGTLYYPESHLGMVRPSLLTFGYIPGDCPDELTGIRPCFSLKAKVSYFKVVPKGSGISYNHSFTTTKQTRIATIPVGYGDGYRRSLSNKGSVLIRGKQFPIVGTICMDQFMVDVGNEEVYVGDEVVLIGKQGNLELSLVEIATLCETIPYEILCLFNERLPRVYRHP